MQAYLGNGEWYIGKKNTDGKYAQISISSSTNFSEVTDKTDLAKAEAEYNAQTLKINNKENREKWLNKLIEDYTRIGVYGSALYEEILIKSIESAYKNSEVYEKLNKEGIKIPDIKSTLMELFNLNPENIEKECS